VADWTHLRDRVVFDAVFAQELQAEFAARGIGAGATLLIAARRIEHAPGYTLRLEGYHVQLVANVYEAAGGAIDVSGHDGAPGNTGARGDDGFANAADSAPGGPGGNGDDGQGGTGAGSITLIVAEPHGARLLARGGGGGDGGQGGNGGRGGDGRAPTRRIEGWEGTGGGAGGAAGHGGPGRNGGQITIRRIAGDEPTSDASGGRAGVGGAGGTGGAAGRLSLQGDAPDGARGADGPAGVLVVPSSATLAPADWWQSVRQLLGSVTVQWADYRTDVGLYHYRRYAPARADTAGLLVEALDEFAAALTLVPGWPRTLQFTRQITANQTPTGVPRNVDLIPDFRGFEGVVTDYGPMVLSLFSSARAMLENAADVGSNKTRLRLEVESLRGKSETLAQEIKIAALERQRAIAERGQTENRLAANQAALDTLAAEERQRRLELDQSQIGTVLEIAIGIAAVAAAIYTGGASIAALAAIPGLLIKAGASLGDELGYDPAPDLYYVRGRHLEDWFEPDPKGGVRLKPELGDLVGGLKKAFDETKGFVDKFRALAELERATVDGAAQTRSKELLKQRLELTFDKAMAVLRDEQTDLQVSAAQRRLELNDADATALAQQEHVLTADVIQLGQIAATLVKQAQRYADVITQYTFLATRAFDVWTFDDRADSFTFDLGHLDPDRLAGAYSALSRGDSTRVTALLAEYLPSWGRLPSIIDLRADFEKYSNELVSDLRFFHVTDPATLDALQLDSMATFDLPIDDFPASRRESKTNAAYITLVGATATNPRVTVLLEHTGTSWARRLDGSVVQLQSPPRTTPISAGLTASDLGGVPGNAPTQSFWGRSPAARWRISIEADERAQSQVDLSGLTEITVALTFQSILV
jgi:hypothetical protein